MTPPPDGWDGILDPGETILWQGAPAPGLALDGGPGLSAFGAVFTAFSLFWIAMAAWIGGGGRIGWVGAVFPLFGLPFLAVGLYLLAGRFLWAAHVRRHTHYTLTDRRAFVATRLFGQRRLASHRIAHDAPLDLVEGPPDSVWFHTVQRPGPHGLRRGRVGFERIEDGRRVLGLLGRVAKGQP